MTSAEATGRVKRKLGILQADTSLDTDVLDAVTTAIDLLAPFAQAVPTADTSVALAQNVSSFTVPVSGSTVTKLWVQPSGGTWAQIDSWTQQGDTIFIYDSFSYAVSVKLLYIQPYTIATIANISRPMTVPLVDFACSEFATFLAGNKTKYDIYQQSGGARGVDSMTALAEFYETRAINRAEMIADSQGVV